MSTIILTRYTRPNAAVSNHPQLNRVALALGGGGALALTESHSLVQFLLTQSPAVYSALLPYHGSLAKQEWKTEKSKELLAKTLDNVEKEILNIAKGKTLISVGYSTGGILMAKLWPRLAPQLAPDSLHVSVGTALRINSTAAMIRKYWSPKGFEAEPGRLEAFAKMHGGSETTWANTRQFVSDMTGQAASPLFPSDSELRFLLSAESRVFFVNGERDQPFPPKECVADVIASVGDKRQGSPPRLQVIDADHFNVLAKSSWPQLSQALTTIVTTQLAQCPRSRL